MPRKWLERLVVLWSPGLVDNGRQVEFCEKTQKFFIVLKVNKYASFF